MKTRLQMRRGTEEEWLRQREFIPLEGEIIVFLPDKSHRSSRIKIGDGNAYLIDLPFVAEDVQSELEEHIKNPDIHITKAEREDWNERVKVDIDEKQEEIVFLLI